MPLLSSYNIFTCLQVDTIMTSEICNIKSNQVVQTISHPPNSNQYSCLPAWEHQLPSKYIVASSLGSMSLSIDIEIEVMDTVVKQCTQALVNCRAM
jgi:predicted transcriptional regulator